MECACVRHADVRGWVGLTYRNESKIMTEKGVQKNRWLLFLVLVSDQGAVYRW